MPTPDRYTSNGRVLHTTITRTPWRHRRRTQRPAAQTQTQAEKVAARQAKVERKIATNGTLEKALGDVWAIAERLHRELGTHTSHYWYEYLMQSAGKKDHERNASGWNAFLSRRIKEINNGKYFLVYICVLTSLLSRVARGCATPQGVSVGRTTFFGVASYVLGRTRCIRAGCESQFDGD